METKSLTNEDLDTLRHASEKEAKMRSETRERERKADCAKRYKKALGNKIHVKGTIDDKVLWDLICSALRRAGIDDFLWNDLYSDDKCIYVFIGSGDNKAKYKIDVTIDTVITIGNVSPNR